MVAHFGCKDVAKKCSKWGDDVILSFFLCHLLLGEREIQQEKKERDGSRSNQKRNPNINYNLISNHFGCKGVNSF